MAIPSEHLSEQELTSRLNLAKEAVETGALYIHTRSKKYYKVVNLAVMESSQEVAVLYQKEGEFSSPIWIRALTSWMEMQEVEGKLVPRFQKIN